MEIAIIGTGYVGLVTGACLADFGHSVTCVDRDAARVDLLNRGIVPFHEPGLTELVSRHASRQRLRFTASVAEAASRAAVIFLAVGTPEGTNGEADLSQVAEAVGELAPHLVGYHVVATKSTVPVGTGALVRGWLEAAGVTDVDVVSNPEFLREGSAISDFLRPDRVVIGTESDRAAGVMRDIYRPLYLIETPMIFTDVETAEMIKYAANGFLAVKISFINEIAALCDRTGADVHVVAKAMGLDKRIGSKFLHPGPGFGGSCFPKDTRALAAIGNRHGVPQQLIEAAMRVNERQRGIVLTKLAEALGASMPLHAGDLAGRTIAVLGLAFKPNTSDVREAPALAICRELLGAGATVRAFDPIAASEAARSLGSLAAQVTFENDPYDAAASADAVLITTEWNEFRGLEMDKLRGVMRGAVLMDCRNVLDPTRAAAAGFVYRSMGRDALVASESSVPAAFTHAEVSQ
jgi:UDPglucose 6-dehydrogenase